MEPETQQKIEQTVLEILKTANMEHMTEFKLRVMASDQLGMDLTSIDCKKFIRGVVESFLLSTTLEGVSAEDDSRQENEAMPIKIVKREIDIDGNLVICQLSNRRNVVIQDFKGKSVVSIREFYYKDGRQLPGNKGINLTPEQWSSLRTSVPLIEEAITKMQAKLRLNLPSESSEQIPTVASTPSEHNGEASNLGTASHNEPSGNVSDFINTSTPHEPNGHISKSSNTTSNELNSLRADSVIASTLQGLVPIDINRFDGKNYQLWAPGMELFLKQLNIAYVLTDPCPSVATGPEASAEEIGQAKAAEHKWLHDDYMCLRNILVCLSDALYNRYSKKNSSAKELWEELKQVYLYEEFGQKRFLVKKYIEFQMVEEKPILEQVQELNNMADSIIAAGIFFDEKFHVSTILSKLPPSWRVFYMKLMCEENLPFWMLMDRVNAEERNQETQAEPSCSVRFIHAKHAEPRTTDVKRVVSDGKRRETDTGIKDLVCYRCGRKGHVSKHCRRKRCDNGHPSPTAITEEKTEHC